MKKIFYIIMVLVLALGVVADDMIAQGQAIVQQGLSCDKLSDDQLQSVGEYLMEQMHPGPAHDAMDKMMGLDQNPTEDKAFHVRLAQSMYCGQGGMMGGNGGYGMMSGYRGMMGGNGGYGMMGWTGSTPVMGILWLVILVGLAILVWLWVIKLIRETRRK